MSKKKRLAAGEAGGEAASKAPRFVARAGWLVDQKLRRSAPFGDATPDALAAECNANPARAEHFTWVPGMPLES